MKKSLIYVGSGILGVGLILFLYNRYASHSGGMIFSGGSYFGESSEEEEESEQSPYQGWPF